ncbi:MAG: hypothetical protein WA261_07540, partial [Candidatus Sulfotelmatobacter sp.]
MHVIGRVHEEDVVVGGGLRLQKVGGFGCTVCQQPVTNAVVFLGGEDVLADGEIVAVTVDKFEGEHGLTLPIILRQPSGPYFASRCGRGAGFA